MYGCIHFMHAASRVLSQPQPAHSTSLVRGLRGHTTCRQAQCSPCRSRVVEPAVSTLSIPPPSRRHAGSTLCLQHTQQTTVCTAHRGFTHNTRMRQQQPRITLSSYKSRVTNSIVDPGLLQSAARAPFHAWVQTQKTPCPCRALTRSHSSTVSAPKCHRSINRHTTCPCLACTAAHAATGPLFLLRTDTYATTRCVRSSNRQITPTWGSLNRHAMLPPLLLLGLLLTGTRQPHVCCKAPAQQQHMQTTSPALPARPYWSLPCCSPPTRVAMLSPRAKALPCGLHGADAAPLKGTPLPLPSLALTLPRLP
jgi:hypothetical protein